MILSIIFLVGLATTQALDTSEAESLLQKADFVPKKHISCMRMYTKIGCFKKSSSPHMKLLINDQDPTSPFNKGYLTDMADFAKSTHSLACRCASQAIREGYTYFSIRFWGQCFVGRDYKNVQSMVDDPHTHSSPDCANPKYQQCNDNHAHECIAWENADYIYSIYGMNNNDPNIDGGYAPWSKWSKCSAECGDGVVTRERTCTKPIPKGKGADCSAKGAASESKECKLKECKVDGGWRAWTKFSTCSRSCGGGVSRRHRICSNPRPKNGGAFCKGSDTETKPCETQHCPVHGGYSQWSAYGPCTATCGDGEKSRVRTCTSPAPAHGGRKCDYLGDAEEKVKCNLRPCPIDGQYTNWGSFTRCTKTCGGGQQTRVRLCSNPRPQFGGKRCVGPFIEVEDCNTDPCPIPGGWTGYSAWDKCTVTCGGGSTLRRRECTAPAPDHGGPDCEGPNKEKKQCNPQNCPINGGFTEWSGFGECTVSCGGGLKTRERECTNPKPQYGGKACVGAIEDTEKCGTQHCPIDGGYSDFSIWNKCSKSCGGGTQIRTRTCTKPAPQYGGLPCLVLGSPVERRECETQPCARYTKFGPWGKCSKKCAGGVQRRTRKCYAPGWKGVVNCSHLGSSYETRKCETQPCPIHGNWGAWTPWGACSKSCGKGSRSKSRKCNNPPPQYGGRACRGYHHIKATCHVKACAVHGGWTQWNEWGACSKECGGGKQVRARECSNPTPKHGGRKCPGAGGATRACNTDFCPIDGGWTQWGMWRKCTVTCGGGRTYRMRQCTKPSPKYGGDRCPGAPIQAKQCGTIECPINGGWSGYSAYGSCTKSCGGGTQTSVRHCTHPSPRYSGHPCAGDRSKSKPCNTHHCPIDGSYSGWSEWSTCSATCGGGTQTRNRACSPPKYGGKGCAVLGHAVDSRECNTDLCPLKPFHVALACEGMFAELTCKEGAGKIHVLEARYGREKHYVCGELNFWDFNCKLSPHDKGLKIATPICEGKQSCRIAAHDSIFGDPCRMTYKYLEIMYRCYDGRYPELNAGDEESSSQW